MFSFMFAVLGSFVFWGLFGLIGLILGTMFLKRLFPITWKFITTGEKCRGQLWIEIIFIILVCYLLWPVVALGFGIYWFFKYVLVLIVWKPFCKLVISIDKNTPSIKIVKED